MVFLHSFNKYLWRIFHTPSAGPGTGGAGYSKADTVFAITDFTVKWEVTDREPTANQVKM